MEAGSWDREGCPGKEGEMVTGEGDESVVPSRDKDVSLHFYASSFLLSRYISNIRLLMEILKKRIRWTREYNFVIYHS